MKQKSIFFIGLFWIISIYCIYGWKFDQVELSGVQREEEEVKLTFNSILDGSYQTGLENKWNSGFPGRNILIKTRSQILYSMFDTTSNNNVIIGKDKYLMEPSYIEAELSNYVDCENTELDEIVADISKLNSLLEKNGKKMYVMISPSKAHFFKDKIPNKMLILDEENADKITYREYFTGKLDETGINYIDATDLITKNQDKFKSPVFYRSGIHWSRVWGDYTAAELIKQIEDDSEYNLNHYAISENISDSPIYPDTDLYDSLNMWKEAEDVWYEPDLVVTEEGKDKPNVFFRGCSFMGQSLSDIAGKGCFNKVVHLENNYCFTNNYSDVMYMENFVDYDELPIDELLGQSDILILEGNESGVENFSFGFVEYLLDHQEYLDSKY